MTERIDGPPPGAAWVTIDIDAAPSAPAPAVAHSAASSGDAGGAAADCRVTPEGFDIVDVEFTGARAQAVENNRNRITLLAACFVVAFSILGLRLLDLTLYTPADVTAQMVTSGDDGPVSRVPIIDRTGEILATDITTPSVAVDPRRVIEPAATADALLTVLPELDRKWLLARLTSGRDFEWIKRKISPRQKAAVHALGLPGISFRHDPHRAYPKGRSAAHVLGYVDIDNHGIAGIEAGLNGRLTAAGAAGGAPLQLSLDMRVQHAVEDELAAAMATFRARRAVGIVLDVHTGEVRALASLPDYDPNTPSEAAPSARRNHATSAVYEMGSTFKVFTTAIGLDSGAATMQSLYDARTPMKIGGHTINDFHAQGRVLSTAEVVMYSSNIGSAQMALDIGVERHRAYLGQLGLLAPLTFELPEIAAPLHPQRWKDIETSTISYGHGLAVSPLQIAAAGAALGNGGYRVAPTLLAGRDAGVVRERVLSREAADATLGLMRSVVAEGTGRRADVLGYEVAGKTGTGEKPGPGGYQKDKLVTSFLAIFPARAPEYLVLVLLDEPQPTPETFGKASAGWNAAPTTGRVIKRIAPILGVQPVPAQLQNPLILEAGLR